MAQDLDYIPVPASVVKVIKEEWAKQIKGADGKPIVAMNR
jgi:hypothetical protein